MQSVLTFKQTENRISQRLNLNLHLSAVFPGKPHETGNGKSELMFGLPCKHCMHFLMSPDTLKCSASPRSEM